MTHKFCSTCGKESSIQANFCRGCGTGFLSAYSAGKPQMWRATELLTASGAIIALVGGIIGIVVSEHYSSIIGFTPLIATFFATSLFGIASFAYSASGLILTIRKKLSQDA